MDLEDIVGAIKTAPAKGQRRLVGLVGAPASGKTTLAHQIAELDSGICVVPMDGFHLDNPILTKRGLLHRKGAPQTFDVDGFVHLLSRLAAGENAIYPLFDRATDRSIAGAGEIDDACDTILVEGNYLLLNAPGWSDLKELWDLTIKLDVPRSELRDRLLERWRQYGFSPEEAARKADENDLPNADLINEQSAQADIAVADLEL